MTTRKLTIELNPPQDAWQAVVAILEDAHRMAGFPSDSSRFCALLRDEANAVEGGVLAETAWGWLYIIALGIRPEWHRQGHGTGLLNTVEDWARQRGCSNAWVTTSTFHALGFYERRGYLEFAKLPHCPGNEVMFFLKKAL